MSDRPNYREQDVCRDCYWVFTLTEWDWGPQYYCCRNAPKRPRCGSCLMGEEFYSTRVDVGSARARAWEKWSAGRRVDAWGRCDAWRERKEKTR